MLGRTKEEHLLPQLLRLGDLTWPRLGRGNHLIRIGRNEELFAVERRLVLADTVDEAVAGGLEEKGAEVVGIGEAQARVAEPAQNVAPDRLDDIDGVELGPQPRRQLAAN